ncbi:uncharacterized protein LOC142542915 [Primulina tabacum]|uniref:uncharacterized protein LOC142542915 n=1 Tax=Primulina tabacum TaxID=48773 RepID=UPI003F5AB2DC
MDQFRQVGEVLGGLNALMVLKHEIPINQRQCCLLYDMLYLAFKTISDEIRQNLRLEDRHNKWKTLEPPMKELHRIFKEADLYIRHCLEIKDWWGKVISLHMNRDCVELHIHNLLSCFPVVIEAIETAAEISGVDEEDMQKRRLALLKKYDQECDDPKMFQWMFGKQYLVPREICDRLDMVWREDRWLLLQKIGAKKVVEGNLVKLAEFLLQKMNSTENTRVKLLPSQVLVGSNDYFVKRRLGLGGGNYKEIHWLGENFALRNFYGDLEPLSAEISFVLSVSHPNVLQYLCGFHDEERKEGFLVMELMNKNLSTYIKENSSQKKHNPFSIPVAVDIMLQISRGMEYLHSKKIYHGELNPSNVFLKSRNASIDGFFKAKVTGFGLLSSKNYASRSAKPTGVDLHIWLSPEVLAEQEQHLGGKCTAKYSEKADVYSFGMLCFELLTGKVPFSDGHLQGETMARNIRAGERPLFSYTSPKYLTNLTKKCWQTNPNLRPTFSSITRILRYIKKILVINPDHGHPDSPPPLVDYCDMETGFLKKFPDVAEPVSQIPFQLFAYKLVEKEKICVKNWDLTIDGLAVHRAASLGDHEHLAAIDDLFLAPSDRRSVCSEIIDRKYSTMVDLRSVISEIPHRKLLSIDQRSFNSESPGKKFSFTVADQRQLAVATPDIRVDQREDKIQAMENKTENKILTCHKLNLEIPDKVILSKSAESKSASPRPQENKKSAITKATDQNLETTEDMEKILVSKTVLDHKTVTCESSEMKMTSRATGYQKLVEIPEKKTLQRTEFNQNMVSVSAETSGARGESKTKSIQKDGNSKNSEKKALHIRKLRETETKQLPGTSKSDSPRSSPTRIKKTNPSYFASSSPARLSKILPANSTSSSPARQFKTNTSYSPSSSPARQFKTIPSHSPSSPARDLKMSSSSPKRSAVHASTEHSSPLNRCSRCSRLERQISGPPTVMSPQRPTIDQVQNSCSIVVLSNNYRYSNS